MNSHCLKLNKASTEERERRGSCLSYSLSYIRETSGRLRTELSLRFYSPTDAASASWSGLSFGKRGGWTDVECVLCVKREVLLGTNAKTPKRRKERPDVAWDWRKAALSLRVLRRARSVCELMCCMGRRIDLEPYRSGYKMSILRSLLFSGGRTRPKAEFFSFLGPVRARCVRDCSETRVIVCFFERTTFGAFCGAICLRTGRRPTPERSAEDYELAMNNADYLV